LNVFLIINSINLLKEFDLDFIVVYKIHQVYIKNNKNIPCWG